MDREFFAEGRFEGLWYTDFDKKGRSHLKDLLGADSDDDLSKWLAKYNRLKSDADRRDNDPLSSPSGYNMNY